MKRKKAKKTVHRVFQDLSQDAELRLTIRADASPAGYVTAEREIELRKLASLPATGPQLAMVLVARDCVALLDEARLIAVQIHYQKTVLDPMQEIVRVMSSVLGAVPGIIPVSRGG